MTLQIIDVLFSVLFAIQMVVAAWNQDWPQATFWLLLLLGTALMKRGS